MFTPYGYYSRLLKLYKFISIWCFSCFGQILKLFIMLWSLELLIWDFFCSCAVISLLAAFIVVVCIVLQLDVEFIRI